MLTDVEQENITSDNLGFSVEIKELSAVHVATMECKVNMASGQHSQKIADSFQTVTNWVQEHHYDVQDPLIIGISQVVNEQLVGFECCIQVSETALEGTDIIKIKDLVGGKFAVVSCGKRPEVVGKAMQQFYQTYVPQHGLQIDETRPEYEIYYLTTVDQCIPIY